MRNSEKFKAVDLVNEISEVSQGHLKVKKKEKKDDIFNFTEKNDEIVKDVFKVCLGEVRESFVKIKPQIEKLRQLLLVLQGLCCEEERILVELSATYNLCVLLLNQPAQDIKGIVRSALKRVSKCDHKSVSYDVRIGDDVCRSLCDVINEIADSASMNVLLLLSTVCAISIMRSAQHLEVAQFLKKVHQTVRIKSVNTTSKKKIPMLIEEPTLVKKNQDEETVINPDACMATDLPGYHAFVVMTITGCYAAGLHSECLELMDDVKLNKEDVLVCLVKAHILLDENKIDECLEVLVQQRRVTTDAATSARIHTLVGQCFSKQNKPHSAIQQYRMALEVDFSQLRPLYLVSLEYQALGRRKEELEALSLLVKSLTHALEDDIRQYPPYVICDVMQHVTKLTLEGDTVSLPFAVHQLAKRCAEINQFKHAVKYYKDLLEILKRNVSNQVLVCDDIPSVVEVLHALISALVNSDEYKEALILCNKCIERHSKVTGKCMLDESASTPLEDLVDSCLDASASAPKLTGSRSNKKRSRSEGSQSSESGHMVELRSLSEDVVALQYKAEILVRLDRNETALECLERLINSLEAGYVKQPAMYVQEQPAEHSPPNKRTKLDSEAANGNGLEQSETSGGDQICDRLFEAYKLRCQVLISQERSDEALHWSRLTVAVKPGSMETLYTHVHLLLVLRRVPEAVTTWLPRRGIAPAQLDKFQISNLIAKKQTALTLGEEDGAGDEVSRKYTKQDLILLEKLRAKHMY